MIFKQFKFDGCLSYITACEQERVGAIIDPSHEMAPYIDVVKQEKLKILYVIDTHTHVDHISLSPELAHALAARTVMYKDALVQREIGKGIKELYGIEKVLAVNAEKQIDMYLAEKDRLVLGNIFLEAIFTPGHTKDSMCLLSNDRIYTGDTLLIGQCGRTDLPGGSSEDMYDTLFTKLRPLSDDLIIYPAHDYKGNINSSLGYEKVNNVCLNSARTVEEFAVFLRGLFPPLSSDGGKLQCGLAMDKEPSLDADEQLNPLMKSFCVSMEQYLQAPHEGTQITTRELMDKLEKKENVYVLDVREHKELVDAGFIPGAHHIPVREVAKRVKELPQDLNVPVVVVCESGIRSAHAAIYLRAYGYANVKNLEFGFREWRNKQYPLVFPKKGL